MKKITKKTEKKAVGAIKKVVTDTSKIVERNEKKYIEKMVATMVVQAGVIAEATKDGVNVMEIMPKIQQAYQDYVAKHTKKTK